MSRLVARILLSIFVFPLAGLLYTVAVVATEQFNRANGMYNRHEDIMFATADAVTWAGVAVYWCLLWRTAVRWTGRRVGWTLGAAVVAAALGSLAGMLVAVALPDGNGSFALFVGGVLAIVLWLVATVIAWRESPLERATRVGAAGGSSVACPTCGYNLTGLAEARCPECGGRFTLDELFAAQPARGVASELG